MKLKNILLLSLAFLIQQSTVQAQPSIQLTDFTSGYTLPVAIENAGDDRLFIVEKGGRIRIINKDGTKQVAPFLSIGNRVNASASELGLLGLAFHPDFQNNGHCFIHYTPTSSKSRVSRFTVREDDPNRIDIISEKIILELDQPFNNHNGGDLKFGPDGYLYIGFGDGGAANDPGNRSQNTALLLGKMLRIDVDVTDDDEAYQVPNDNPFIGNAAIPDEIWAIGLRNPWRYAFDQLTGDLWIADVGQGAYEEINFQAASSQGGENYGWRCFEGSASFNIASCPPAEDLTLPVYDYRHVLGNCGGSVTGGRVYRGEKFEDLQGFYFYADYCTGLISAISQDTSTGVFTNYDLLNGPTGQISTFGEDNDGEIYVAMVISGEIKKIESTLATSTFGNQTFEAVNISPNPFNDYIDLSLESSKLEELQLSLIDINGKVLNRRKLAFSGALQHRISTEDLAAGMYFIRLEAAGAIQTHKVIKF